MPTPHLSEWTYPLPDEAIARIPPTRRDGGRLLVLSGQAPPAHRTIHDLPAQIRPGDVVVLNDSRVLSARLRGHRASGGAVDLLVLHPGPGDVPALCRPARRLRVGERLIVGDAEALIVEGPTDGIVVLRFTQPVSDVLARFGETPLPPYLHRAPSPEDRERYQTVYAKEPGSVAAPTAGLHLTDDLLAAFRARGAVVATVTLHIGPGTFRPVEERHWTTGRLHAERYEIPEETTRLIQKAREQGGRVVAIGTTTTRVLETATPEGGNCPACGAGQTELFLRPPARPRCVDALLTNFHLPQSSLLLLVGTFVPREALLAAYVDALARGYRFASYGDAMFIE